mmetsp:Transcript_86334/g.180667  ORF Transcript_86334/g.180667 Transcript_86334/m.180667 type:complete len:324 (+) Transcript_86334:184-1155(+)
MARCPAQCPVAAQPVRVLCLLLHPPKTCHSSTSSTNSNRNISKSSRFSPSSLEEARAMLMSPRLQATHQRRPLHLLRRSCGIPRLALVVGRNQLDRQPLLLMPTVTSPWAVPWSEPKLVGMVSLVVVQALQAMHQETAGGAWAVCPKQQRQQQRQSNPRSPWLLWESLEKVKRSKASRQPKQPLSSQVWMQLLALAKGLLDMALARTPPTPPLVVTTPQGLRTPPTSLSAGFRAPRHGPLRCIQVSPRGPRWPRWASRRRPRSPFWREQRQRRPRRGNSWYEGLGVTCPRLPGKGPHSSWSWGSTLSVATLPASDRDATTSHL